MAELTPDKKPEVDYKGIIDKICYNMRDAKNNGYKGAAIVEKLKLSTNQISIIRTLPPHRLEDETFEYYRLRLELDKLITKYVRFNYPDKIKKK